MWHLQVGRYENPEEQPFSPENLPPSLVPPQANPPVINSIYPEKFKFFLLDILLENWNFNFFSL